MIAVRSTVADATKIIFAIYRGFAPTATIKHRSAMDRSIPLDYLPLVGRDVVELINKLVDLMVEVVAEGSYNAVPSSMSRSDQPNLAMGFNPRKR